MGQDCVHLAEIAANINQTLCRISEVVTLHTVVRSEIKSRKFDTTVDCVVLRISRNFPCRIISWSTGYPATMNVGTASGVQIRQTYKLGGLN